MDQLDITDDASNDNTAAQETRQESRSEPQVEIVFFSLDSFCLLF